MILGKRRCVSLYHCKKFRVVLNLPSLSQFQLALFIETETTGGLPNFFAVYEHTVQHSTCNGAMHDTHIIGRERKRAHLVVQPARFLYTCPSKIYLRSRLFSRAHAKSKSASVEYHRSATGSRLIVSSKVAILPPCVSQFYARLRFSATRDTTSSTDNHCPSTLQRCQRLLNVWDISALYTGTRRTCIPRAPRLQFQLRTSRARRKIPRE